MDEEKIPTCSKSALENSSFLRKMFGIKRKTKIKITHALSYVTIVNQRNCRDNPSRGVSTYYYFSVHLMC